MGGARCAYRSCVIRSDPKKRTHMFHFPVFDKVRCHQWITNSQRLEYLDLKLSQLKNRVICEHHFKEDDFMNFKKDKLKNNAVPTENGLYCTETAPSLDNKELPINVDDIENDFLTTSEKKAHFPVKYADFLTNDFTDPTTITIKPNNKTSSISLLGLLDKGSVFNRKKKYVLVKPQNNQKPHILNKEIQDTESKYSLDMRKKDVIDTAASMSPCKQLPDPKVVGIQFEELYLTERSKKPDDILITIPPQGNINKASVLSNNKICNTDQTSVLSSDNIRIADQTVFPSDKVYNSSKTLPLSKKVKIISEKKITKPLQINGQLQPVTSSLVLKIPNNKPVLEINDSDGNKTYYINVTNPEQTEDIEKFDNNNIISTQRIIDLNTYNNTDALVNQLDNVNLQNSDLFVDNNKPVVNIVSDVNNHDTQWKMANKMLTETEMLNLTTVPIEYIPHGNASMPQISAHMTDSMFMENAPVATKDLNSSTIFSLDPNTLLSTSPNVTQVTVLSKTDQNNWTKSKNRHDNIKTKKPAEQSSPNKIIAKSKMPPHKLAYIEEKRKFNMKIRDIIESCLNKLDDDVETTKLSPAMKKDLVEKKVGQHLSEDSKLPSAQENHIAYLEARLQRMEDTLLNKIEQNSQRINEFRKTIKPLSNKRSAYTQTSLNAETKKKHLYQQISQFLSPEANSLIYQELFINPCVEKSLNTNHLPKKRRKKGIN